MNNKGHNYFRLFVNTLFISSQITKMGYQLWLSPYTGLRRKGTTFKELEALFIDQITTKFIYEPLYSCHLHDESKHVKEELSHRDFDYSGVIDSDKRIIGFCIREELGEGPIEQFLRPFDLQVLISDSTALCKLFSVFNERPYAFVLAGNQVSGIVTVWDINKPVVRIYLFGIISLFELHLNYWIDALNPEGIWDKKIKPERLEDARKLLDLRKGNNNDLTLLECLQISDKKVILLNTPEFLDKFKFSRRKLEDVTSHIEVIRNEIAHSQNSIISNLAWAEFSEIVSAVEKFLKDSEEMLETKINTIKD
jgi:hypothetical protein